MASEAIYMEIALNWSFTKTASISYGPELNDRDTLRKQETLTAKRWIRWQNPKTIPSFPPLKKY
jgi:hypothetical protein